ncbi:MAG: hypothetical protein R3D26_09860 [Cyanobacteriota/Melainabacteria group bacterium]
MQEPNLAGRLVSANYGPIIRKDFAELNRLPDRIRTLSKDGKEVFIASITAFSLENDILRNLERKKNRDIRSRSSQTGRAPMLDSRDALALEGLLTADYVVLAAIFADVPTFRKIREIRLCSGVLRKQLAR